LHATQEKLALANPRLSGDCTVSRNTTVQTKQSEIEAKHAENTPQHKKNWRWPIRD
jgi:hypothetical protein